MVSVVVLITGIVLLPEASAFVPIYRLEHLSAPVAVQDIVVLPGFISTEGLYDIAKLGRITHTFPPVL